MLYVHEGNLLDNVHSGVIVHGCNSKGVMGSGFAKQVRDKYPKAFDDYAARKQHYGLKMGEVISTVTTDVNNKYLVICNAITQKEFGTDKNVVYVNYESIASAFKQVYKIARDYGLADIHFPKIGAGLANGDWDKILEIIKLNAPDNRRLHLWVLPEETVAAPVVAPVEVVTETKPAIPSKA